MIPIRFCQRPCGSCTCAQQISPVATTDVESVQYSKAVVEAMIATAVDAERARLISDEAREWLAVFGSNAFADPKRRIDAIIRVASMRAFRSLMIAPAPPRAATARLQDPA